MSKSKRIDRVIVGVGRIALSSGTDHAGTFRRINAMITGLAKIGRLDILKGIKEGVYAPLVVLYHYERGQLDKLPTAETSALLLPALRHFRETHRCSASYRADLGTTVRHLERTPGAKTATVGELPRLLRKVRHTMQEAETFVAFNRLRAHALAFARAVQGELTPLWTDVKRVERFTGVEGQSVRPKLRRALTVAELDAVMDAFTDAEIRAGKRGGGSVVRRVIPKATLARMAWTLATTGMRPQEYWEREGTTWTDKRTHVWVEGKKTRAAKRPTYRMGEPERPACAESFYRDRFTEATEKALRLGLDLYSLRYTFQKLNEDAVVPESRRRAYHGHGPKTVTDRYLRVDLPPLVPGDQATVTAWIERERATNHTTLKLETGR